MKHLRLLNAITALCLVVAIASAHITPVFAAPTDPIQSNSLGIDGTVRGHPPTVPATIAIPVNGQTVTALPIKVSGLCTGDVLVKVFSNGVFVGSTQCTGGSYSILIDLFNGTNDIVVRIYDALDQAGPDSATVTVIYTQGGFNISGSRVTLTSDYAKRGANPGENLIWPIILSGGTAPFAVSVDWGDSSTQLVSRGISGSFDISHSYASPGTYTVIVKVTDAAGQSAFLQLVAVANGALAQANQSSASNGSITTRSVVTVWPIIISGVLIIVSFWLGGRYKLEYLRRQSEKRIQY
ncbi:hypothetical protein BH10PAT3_BH10PAT3_2710 [soil metagenome]